MIVWGIPRQECPRRDQTANVGDPNICTNSGGTCSVRDNVGANLSVAERAERVCARGDEEGSAVSHVRVFGGEEHNVTSHYRWCGHDEEDETTVEFPGQEREENGEELSFIYVSSWSAWQV